jgi:hypothetical protein
MRRIFFISLLSMACGAESLDVGDTDAGATGATGGANGSGGSGPRGTPIPRWPARTECVPSSDLEIVGTWEGEVRNFSFRTLVPLRLEILGASEDGGVCGTLRWGEGAPPEPVTDPSRGWPDDERLGFPGPAAFFYEGATYTLLEGVVRDNNVRFQVNSAELWKDWCALQTPYLHTMSTGNGTYQCLPDYQELHMGPAGPTATPSPCTLEQASGPSILIDGGLCRICSAPICVCDETKCGANLLHAYPSPRFDLLFEGNEATGKPVDDHLTAALGTDPLMTDIVLHRVE